MTRRPRHRQRRHCPGSPHDPSSSPSNSAPTGATVTLWRRRLAVDRRLTMIERLVTAGRLPSTVAAPPQIAATATAPAPPAASIGTR